MVACFCCFKVSEIFAWTELDMYNILMSGDDLMHIKVIAFCVLESSQI